MDNILVDLDSLFDTRLTVLDSMGDGLVKDTLERGYLIRRKDVFGNIGNDIFTRFYNARDRVTLINSLPTGIAKIIKMYLVKLITNKSRTGSGGPPKVFINTYPYDLWTDEISVLGDSFKAILGGIEVVMMTKSTMALTPKWLKGNVATMVMYDGMRWLEAHASTGTLTMTPLLDIELIVPMLILGDMPSDGVNDGVFKDTSVICEPLVQLAPMRVREFCAT